MEFLHHWVVGELPLDLVPETLLVLLRQLLHGLLQQDDTADARPAARCASPADTGRAFVPATRRNLKLLGNERVRRVHKAHAKLAAGLAQFLVLVPVDQPLGAPTCKKSDSRIIISTMSKVVTATEAARSFSDLLNRVRYRGESFVIRRGSEEVGRLVPPAPGRGTTLRALAEELRQLGSPDEAFADDLEAVSRAQPSVPEDPWRS